MLGFLFKVTAGAVKLGVKYVILPAVITVAVAVAAEAIAEGIREHTPHPNGSDHRRSRRLAVETA
jgi:hypothetical protein